MPGSDLIARFAAVFDEVGAGAAERDRLRTLPYAEVERLREAGFTRVTLPVEHGGDGAGHAEFFDLLAELARRDPNLAQLFRSHFSFVDRTVLAPPSAQRDARLALVAEGRIIGNASHERSAAKVGAYSTALSRDAGGALVLNGTKFYSTGTLFADYTGVAATTEDGGLASVLVATDAPGVDRVDDWNGFGQRLTGSGTTVFDGVAVHDDDVAPFRRGERPSHAGAFVQLVLLAVVAGIGRAIVDDAVRFVRARTRTYSHGSGATAQQDPIVQETIGELEAARFAADAAVASVARGLDRSTAAIRNGEREDRIGDIVAGLDADAARAQLVVLPAVLDAATRLFEVGGASATDLSLGFDRHWRNARTVASHNPARYKARALGDLLLNDTPVAGWWSTGEA
ncbi:acyl-CoA dehydrogenase family protein [Microbacterium stercoris]|uniref:Dibenzothiophene monooxygenase n=1 Tax=Microbacterium stercoris TaxID=2820289 RepID=A0A939TXA2_9MICO|nr:acyl-CoA dehydrogenase family protein [Microbacterium stercoris]MBO3663452.1 acyl-CoA dehydrogenase family protein [Microbacterium stercoris]